jgi:hypothetical protein
MPRSNKGWAARSFAAFALLTWAALSLSYMSDDAPPSTTYNKQHGDRDR